MRQMLNDMPSEILINIFKRLKPTDLLQCRVVCRSWYMPTKCQLLENVCLQSLNDFESFCSYIEENPVYTAAVKKLIILMPKGYPERLKVLMNKLFDLQLDIKELCINKVVAMNVDKLHKHILKAYPNLEKFHRFLGIDDSIFYQELIDGLRGSLTDLEFAVDDQRNTLVPNSLDGFQKLQVINTSTSTSYDNCKTWLPLFHQEFTLNTLKTSLTREDEDNFMIEYLESRDERTEEEIIWKLSKLQTLKVDNLVFCPASIQFISQYMTGLKSLVFCDRIFFVDETRDAQLQVFHEGFIDLLCSLCGCYITLLDENELRLRLPIIRKFFLQLPLYSRNVARVLKLVEATYRPPFSLELASNILESGELQRVVGVFFFEKEILGSLINMAISTLKIDTLMYSHFTYSGPDHIEVIQSLLDNLPDVKNVFFETRKKLLFRKQIQRKQYPQVESLIIRAEKNMTLKNSWNKLTGMFPSITSLTLVCFCGIYNASKKEYQMFLPKVKLDRLDLDIRHLWWKAIHRSTVAVDYFILDIRAKDQKLVYKVTLDEMIATEINNGNIVESTRREDEHLRIHVSVDYIRFISIVLFRKDCFCRDGRHFRDGLLKTTLDLTLSST